MITWTWINQSWLGITTYKKGMPFSKLVPVVASLLTPFYFKMTTDDNNISLVAISCKLLHLSPKGKQSRIMHVWYSVRHPS